MSKILIIDDDEGVCYSLARLLSNDDRRVTAVQTADTGMEALRGEDPDLVLLDVEMPSMDGLELLRQIRTERPRQLVVIMTAYGTTETAIEAMKRGAYDYLMKPFEAGILNAVVERALESARMNKRVVTSLDARGREAAGGSDHIVGRSRAMQEVYKKIGQVASREVPVLIRGESGTGKELLARALWQHSNRADKPFLAVNCAAIPETLLEGELFGHEKGSFTGAERRRLGKFEQADKGTLFLDEVGDMSMATQAKILRVLQNNTFERVGGAETIKVDVRILAATHQDLEQLIKDGRFREDLYYRLRVVEIALPSLRQRRTDIAEIAYYFLARHRAALGSAIEGVSPKAMEALTAYEWPGNIRQLENVIRRAMVLCNGPVVGTEHLEFGPETRDRAAPPALHDATGAAAAGPPSDTESLVERLLDCGKDNLIDEMERLLIARALEKLNGNQVRAARLLGITRNTLRSRIARYGLRPKVRVM